MKNKGFTLIELLAVIIILGILMIIAIPSVTKYISDSRKNAYIDTAKEIIGGARNLVNEGRLEMYDTDSTYYIESSCIKTENASKSPYGDFTKAYVVVTYDGKGYTYYWTSVDDAGQGIKNLIRVDKLDVDNIESDLLSDDVKTNRGIDGRSKTVVISKQNNCQKEGENQAEVPINGETGEIVPITYPNGKDKPDLEVGDLVKIGTEEFYVISNDGTNVVLLSHYNLNVGTWTNPEGLIGIQNSKANGIDGGSTGLAYGSVSINMNYWEGHVGEGLDYPGIICWEYSYLAGTKCAYVFDSHSGAQGYIDYYKEYLSDFGAKIKEARLMKVEEAYALGCGKDDWKCNSSVPAFVTETSYCLGSARTIGLLWEISRNGRFNHVYNRPYCGIRPVIVI